MNSRNPAAAKPAVSHEAKLGIMVISILVFAFCFLVYHKMDLRQRQLTQAAIAPQGEQPKSGSESADAGNLNGPEQLMDDVPAASHEQVDSLIHRQDLADGSPFGATEALMEPATAEVQDAGAEPSFAGDFQSDENSRMIAAAARMAEAGADENSFTALAAESQDSFGSAEDIAGNASPGAADMPELSNFSGLSGVPPESTPDTPPSGAGVAASGPADSAYDETPSNHLSPDFDVVQQETAPDDTPELSGPAEVRTGSDSTSFLAQTELPGGTMNAGDEAEFSQGQQEEAGFDGLLEEPGDRNPEQEPTLLAMADPEPGQSRDEGIRFDGLDSAAAGFNGVASGSEGLPRDSESRLVAAQESTEFGSAFDAVTQPAERNRNRNSIRTAAGSGADGKFSLAAFNYQNNGVESAPDDGTTYDSVIVQKGDNYTKISKRVYGAGRYFSALAVFNQHRIADPSKMRPGMVVLTPPAELLEERYPQLFEGSKPKVVEPAAFLVLDDGSPAYRVGERETLSEIAERFLGRSSRWVEIYRLNQTLVSDPNKLKAGIILALPDDATEVIVTP